MELGEQLTWLLLVLILICLCCRYILFAFCRFSLKLFLTLLTEAESKGLCLESLTPLCPLLPNTSPLSWSGHSSHPQGPAGHRTEGLYNGARCPSSPSLKADTWA